MSNDLFYWLFTIQNHDVRNPEPARRYLQPEFGPNTDLPFVAVLPEPKVNSTLPDRMVVFTHRSFLYFAVDILGIGFVFGFQVGGQRHKFKPSRHNRPFQERNVLARRIVLLRRWMHAKRLIGSDALAISGWTT
jgi:hypothetical protein